MAIFYSRFQLLDSIRHFSTTKTYPLPNLTISSQQIKSNKHLTKIRLSDIKQFVFFHAAARQKINEEYRMYKDVQEEEKIRERIEFSKAVEDELRTTVVQAREKEPGRYVLRITPETTKLDNFPFDSNVEIPRAKRRELAKACCQVKIDTKN